MRVVRSVAGMAVVLALVAATAAACTTSANNLSAAPTLPGAGPCFRMNEGQVRYPTGDANRVTFATAEAYGKVRVLITSCVQTDAGYVQEWQSTGFAGENGFGRPGLVEVDSLETPTGSFTVTEAFGRSDPGTLLEYNELRPDSRWGGRYGPDYNQYFEGEGRRPDENLWNFMEDGLYEQAAVINYNRPPDMVPVEDASYAIFLHAGNQVTWGCISTDLESVTRFLETAVPGDRMVMGVTDELFAPASASNPRP